MTTSSSDRNRIRNVPPPQGGKPASTYARFIPREEVQNVSAWNPDSFGGPARNAAGVGAGPAANAPPPPTPEQQRAALSAARQAGYQEGYRDGLVALEGFKQSFARQATQQIGQLLASFDDQLGHLEAQMAEALAHAATSLARQVVRHELEVHPELVAGVAREALAGLMLSARHVTVQVHPDDLPLVAEGAADELERRGARLVAVPGIARGGCLIESDVGVVDAGIESRWHRAAGSLGDGAPLGRDDDGPEALILRDGDVA